MSDKILKDSYPQTSQLFYLKAGLRGEVKLYFSLQRAISKPYGRRPPGNNSLCPTYLINTSSCYSGMHREEE